MLLLAPPIRLSLFAVEKFIQHQIVRKRHQEMILSETADKAEKATNMSIQSRHECKNLATIVNHLEIRVAQLSEQVDAFKSYAYGDILQGG